MTTPPLSAAAQAVLDAVVDGALPPFHVIARPMAAAAIRALVEQVVPDEGHTLPIHIPSAEWFRFDERKKIRAEIFAIAAELDGGEAQHTTQPTETPDEHA